MLGVLVAELAEPGRLRRGRALAEQGAVGELEVEPGLLVAAVQGSERDPYRVTVRVATVGTPEPGARLTELVPHRRQLRFECSCPDDDVPCKHGVAVMTRFAQRLSYDPALFLLWRTGTVGAVPPGLPPATATPTAATTSSPAAAPTADPAPARLGPGPHAALRELLGDPTASATDQPELTALPGPTDVWDEIWRSMLTDALDTLRRGRVRPPAGSR